MKNCENCNRGIRYQEQGIGELICHFFNTQDVASQWPIKAGWLTIFTVSSSLHLIRHRHFLSLYFTTFNMHAATACIVLAGVIATSSAYPFGGFGGGYAGNAGNWGSAGYGNAGYGNVGYGAGYGAAQGSQGRQGSAGFGAARQHGAASAQSGRYDHSASVLAAHERTHASADQRAVNYGAGSAVGYGQGSQGSQGSLYGGNAYGAANYGAGNWGAANGGAYNGYAAQPGYFWG